MSREIKFRGKSKWSDNHEWVYGDLIRKVLGGNIHLFIKPLDGKEVEVEYKTVGQFIGKRDNSKPIGVEIYEGDKIKLGEGTYDISYEPNQIVTVEWDNSFTGFKPFQDTHSDYNTIDSSDVEIIGNIHQ